MKLGKISGVFGIKGWVKVYAFTDDRKNILNYQPWYIERNNKRQAVKIRAGKLQGKSVVALLEGVDDRNEAETWIGLDIYIPHDQLPTLGENEFYWSDLIGLNVKNTDGVEFGRIDKMLETGANDVLVVKGDQERLIPFVMHQVVVEVDIDGKQMVVDWDADF